MSVLRNRFLNTAAVLFGPNDPPAGGKPTTLTEDVGNEDDSGEAGDATAQDDNGDAGDDTGAEGEAEGEPAAGTEEDDGEADAEDDDPDLAGFTPEQRQKIQAKIVKETRWRDRQLERVHAKRRSAEEDARAASTIAAGAVSGENLTATQIEERARTLASQMSAQDRYDADCNAAYAKGNDVYQGKWKTALDQLPKLGGVDASDMSDIVSTDNPHVVLFQLSDPDVYERVMALPPARRRNEFVKLSLKDAPKPRTESKRPGEAPAPVKPLNNGRRVAAQSVNLADDKVADDLWYAERNRTRRKKFSNVE